MDAWIWIVVVVVVLAVVIGVLVSRSRQQESRRAEAAELRQPTADHQMELREKEAAAAASEAEARRVRAEADQRAAEAQHLEVQAQRADKDKAEAASAHEEQLRRADALDPDVRTDKEGYRLDDDGNRIETPLSEQGEQGAEGGAHRAAGEHPHLHERIGNIRRVDEPEGTIERPTGTTGETRSDVLGDDGEGTGREGDALDRARDRADDVITRRDAEGRQPE